MARRLGWGTVSINRRSLRIAPEAAALLVCCASVGDGPRREVGVQISPLHKGNFDPEALFVSRSRRAVSLGR